MAASVTLDEPLLLGAPTGEAVTLREATLSWEREGVAIDDVWLSADLSAAECEGLMDGAFFHLDPEARGPIFGGEFDLAQPLRLELRLGQQHIAHLWTAAESIEDAAEVVSRSPLSHPLRRTESWYATTLTQAAEPGLRTGMRTRWLDDRP